MKLSFTKSLIAAVATATMGSAAFAEPIPSNGLFFSAFNGNPDAPSSIVINLGVTADDFLANPNQSYTLNATDAALLSNWLNSLSPANLATTEWGVYASSAAAPSAQGTPDYFILTTGVSGIAGDPFNDQFNWNNSYLEAVIATNIPSHLSLRANPNLASSNTYAPNNTDGLFFTEANGGPGIDSRSGLNEAATFYSLFPDQGEDFGPDAAGDYLAFLSWSLSFEGGMASLNYGDGTPEIPVPAAVWLFASGLLGMAGVSRRKAKSKA